MMKKHETALRYLEVFAIAGSFVVACLALYYVRIQDGEISRARHIQTLLQGNITELTRNQTRLQETVFKLENYAPTVRIQSVQPISIGPTPPIDYFPSGVASFQYNGTLRLDLTVLVSTAHSGELIIPASSMYFYGYNTSQLQISFSGLSGISTEDYVHAFTAGSAEIVSVSIPFRTFYRFSESHILEYECYDIGHIGFSLIFHDFQTDSIKYSENLRTSFVWNNQTSLP